MDHEQWHTQEYSRGVGAIKCFVIYSVTWDMAQRRHFGFLERQKF